VKRTAWVELWDQKPRSLEVKPIRSYESAVGKAKLIVERLGLDLDEVRGILVPVGDRDRYMIVLARDLRMVQDG
jgi:hypothetical protein